MAKKPTFHFAVCFQLGDASGPEEETCLPTRHSGNLPPPRHGSAIQEHKTYRRSQTYCALGRKASFVSPTEKSQLPGFDR